jgi:outer membrane protein OmpA-like peptidoglycan-associated protein
MSNIFQHKSSGDDEWISVSDMMAGLMMIFLFLSIIYIENISKYFSEVSDLSDDICADLRNEFEQETNEWDMSICENGLLISFESDSNFEVNSANLSAEFSEVLESFYPRLMNVMFGYRETISELRIEGHTDSSVRATDSRLTGYVYNTQLSQNRSRNVMEFALALPLIIENEQYLDWSFTHVTAHGMSSSKNVFDANGIEDYAASRRVEFRLRTTAEERLLDLVSEIKASGT